MFICRSAGGGGRPGAGPLQTQAAASEVGDSGEAGEDAAGGTGARQASGSGRWGAAGARTVGLQHQNRFVLM